MMRPPRPASIIAVFIVFLNIIQKDRESRAPTIGGVERSEAREVFPGWFVVTAAFVILMTSSGLAFYGLAAYLNAFSKERGWEVSSVSLATTIFFLVGGLVGVVVSRIIAVRDMRYVIV